MQLKHLYIKDYKILKDFHIDFPYDFKKYVSVFIGANGSGKSTILEAIAQIFSSVYLNEKAKLLSLNNGKFREFCMVGVYVIDKKHRRMN